MLKTSGASTMIDLTISLKAGMSNERLSSLYKLRRNSPVTRLRIIPAVAACFSFIPCSFRGRAQTISRQPQNIRCLSPLDEEYYIAAPAQEENEILETLITGGHPHPRKLASVTASDSSFYTL